MMCSSVGFYTMKSGMGLITNTEIIDCLKGPKVGYCVCIHYFITLIFQG